MAVWTERNTAVYKCINEALFNNRPNALMKYYSITYISITVIVSISYNQGEIQFLAVLQHYQCMVADIKSSKRDSASLIQRWPGMYIFISWYSCFALC
jgi:hypothetical protein